MPTPMALGWILVWWCSVLAAPPICGLLVELCKRKENVGQLVSRPGTYELTLLQALSLTTAPWLCHWRVIRTSPDVLSPKQYFSLANRFWNFGPKYAPVATRQSQNAPQTVALIIITVEVSMAPSMSQDFRGDNSGAMYGPSGHRLDGDSLDHIHTKYAYKWQPEALHHHQHC